MKLFNGLKATAVILCAGTGERTGLPYNKILHAVGVKTVFELTLDAFKTSCVGKIAAVVNAADEAKLRELAAPYFGEFDGFTFVRGGNTRGESVKNGLAAIKGCDVAVIHDCARPFITADLIDATVKSAAERGSGIAAVKTTDTIKRVKGGEITGALERADLYNAQTPQSFRYAEIFEAYSKAEGSYTDDSEVYAAAGYTPYIVEGDYGNIKITAASDLYKTVPIGAKIGVGFDVHPLRENRPLILGGVRIEHSKGLYGHSDADVLTHAVIDALLSAAELPDIGVLYPDSDPSTEGISSILLLKDALSKAANFKILSVSAVIMAQKPKLSGYIKDIRRSLSEALESDESTVNVSATTAEHLGIIGEEKGIAASAVVMVRRKV